MAWVKICIFTNIRLTVLWKRPKYLRSFAPAYKIYYIVYSIVKITFQSQNFRYWKFQQSQWLGPLTSFLHEAAQRGSPPSSFPGPGHLSVLTSGKLHHHHTLPQKQWQKSTFLSFKNSRNFQPQSSPLSSLKLHQLFSLFLVGQKLRIW